MLNERRVKHMVKLASYETREGAEDFKVSSYFKKDYISFNVLCTLLWVTLGYVLLVALLGMAYMDVILDNLTMQSVILYAVAFIMGWIGVMVFYGVGCARYYKKKHAETRQRVKRYKHQLEILEKMYDKEDA